MDLEQLVRHTILSEVAAMSLYTRLANSVVHDDQRGLLRMLAAAEESHIGRLTELVGELGEEGARVLGSIGLVAGLRLEADKQLEDQLAAFGLGVASTVRELLHFAIAMEAKAGGHYSRLAAEAADERLRAFFSLLVEEEAGHAAQLEHLRQMLEASSPTG
ncbi:MAG: hypothetical protein A2138_02695 [Deltaproteobacteria bacterium RBG_16_71_12]|nr:MAG: hypothetical protein A2138_02695 [Deltaproteobacteria bacterium RBG_16_71_12]